jgi:DNA-binding transcriptional ArsR family regulator
MLDQIRHEIQARLDELLAEADKLRHALAALSSRDGATPTNGSGTSRKRAPRSAAAANVSSTSRKRPGNRRSTEPKPTVSAGSTAADKSTAPAASSSTSSVPARSAPGTTKTAVLKALADGNAMTAGEVATVTGLGRASVSTTLSKLANSGEVTKAARGYQIAAASTNGSEVGAKAKEDEQAIK